MVPAGKATTEPAARLTWRQVAAWRLQRQHLDRRAGPEDTLAVVAGLCGLHAQLMSSAELTLWARIEPLDRDAVSRALWRDRSLVKTWAMRGTLHVLAAAEYGLWQAALSTYRHFQRPAWLRAFGVTAAELDRLVTAVGDALEGPPLTRDELADEVARLTGSPSLAGKLRDSWGALLKPASFRGQLCIAPSQGQLVRFTRPDLWLGGWPAVDPTAALAEVTRRFLAAHGPATREDLGRWWGLPPAPAGRLLSALGDEVAAVDVEGTRAWMLAAQVAEAEGAVSGGSVRLLPAFDQYVVGATRHAARLMAGDFGDRVHRAQGWVSPVLVVNGRMDGVWRHERAGSRLVVHIEPFVDLPAWARRGAQDEAARLADHLGGTLELAWGN